MANSVQEDTRQRKNFRCPVCLDVFSGPKVLSCGHSFCEDPCLTNIADGSGFLRCPECRVVTRLPSKGIGGLPTNFSLLRAISDEGLSDYRCATHKLIRNITCHTCDTDICRECANGPEHEEHDSEISRVLETARVANNSFNEFTRMLKAKRAEIVRLISSVDLKNEEISQAIKESASCAREEIDELEGALLMALELGTAGDRQRFIDTQGKFDKLLMTTDKLKSQTTSLVNAVREGDTDRIGERFQLEGDVIGLYNNILTVAKEPAPRRSQVVVFRPSKSNICIGELKVIPAPPSREPPSFPEQTHDDMRIDVPAYMEAQLIPRDSPSAIYENIPHDEAAAQSARSKGHTL